MSAIATEAPRPQPGPAPAALSLPVLLAASLCHFLNDLMQSLFTASYPVFKDEFVLSFTQIGVLTLVYQLSASILQPLVGLFTDARPQPYSLAVGMGFSMAGLVTLGFAPSYELLLLGAALLGIGSSIFHPESSRLARLASGGAHGLAQSIFQVGGNVGSALGPLLVAFVVLPLGQGSLAWFALLALVGMAILTALGRWYSRKGHARPRRKGERPASALSRGQIRGAFAVLLLLLLSKYFYLASFNTFYVFYLMERFALDAQDAQLCLFAFLGAVAAGTLAGGPIGDRIGRRKVIWGSILGVLPFTLALPHVGLAATIALSIAIGLVLASAFAAIVVYAQSLLPHRVGMVSGLVFGFAFGLGGLGAALLGRLADATSVVTVYHWCAFLPALGILTLLLPDTEGRGRRAV